MLNAGGFNTRALNTKAVLPVLIQATITFNSVGLTWSADEADMTRGATATWDCSLYGIFSADRSAYAQWHVNGSATVFAPALMHYQTSGAWSGVASSFIGEGTRTHQAIANWVADAVFTGNPRPHNLNADLFATSDLDPVPTLIGALEANWSTSSSIVIGEADITRYATMDLAVSGKLWAESTLTLSGITEIVHDGFAFFDGTLDWAASDDGVVVFTVAAFYTTGAQMHADAHVIHGAVSTWGITTELDMAATRVLTTTADMWQGAVNFMSDPTLAHISTSVDFDTSMVFTGLAQTNLAAVVNMSGEANIEALPTLSGALSGYWVSGSAMQGVGTRIRLCEANWAASGILAPMEAKVIKYANADWLALGASNLTGGAILQLVPAPEDRTFDVPEIIRVFDVGEPGRILEVTS